jgi:hypothetical protein
MRLVVALTPSALEITPLNDPSGAHRYLISIGALHLAARAGNPSASDAGESPSLAVTLSNEGKRLSAIAGCPMRARVDVYDDDDALFFSGLIASISFGRAIVWTLEA